MINKKLYKIIKTDIFFLLFMTGIVFSLYGKSINFDFVCHDDDSLILEKADFLSHITNIPKLFLTSCYYSNTSQYYRPILNFSFLLETTAFGLNTKIYHLTNIILFILALYLMYVFLLKLNLNKTILKCLILLVSIHPILTSCAVWIPARNDTLLAIFIFSSFIFFIKYLETNSTKNLFLYILFFTIALFTKETALIIFVLYPIFVVCFNYKLSKKEIYKNILIFIPILIVYFYLRSLSVNLVSTRFYFDNAFLCFGNFVAGISTYLYNFFIPSYVPIMLYDIGLTINNIILDVFLSVIIMFLWYKKVLNSKLLLFSIIWFILCLISTFLLQEYVYLNHRLILSLFAIVLLLTYLTDSLITRYKTAVKYLLLLYVILFSFFFVYSYNLQNKYKNKYEYWINSYIDAPTYNGCSYWMSKFFLEKNDFDNAKKFLEKARYGNEHTYESDLALIYYREGDIDKAEELYNKSIEYGINKAQCYRNLSVIYLKRDNDINKAIEYAKLAVNEDPYDDGYKQYLQKLTEVYKESINEKVNI